MRVGVLPLIGLRHRAAARLGPLRVFRLVMAPDGTIVVGAMVHPDAEEAPEPTVGYVIWWHGWRLVIRPLPDRVYEVAAFAATSALWAGLSTFAYVVVALRLHA